MFGLTVSNKVLVSLSIFLSGFTANTLQAEPQKIMSAAALQGVKSVSLLDKNGQRTVIGSITFTQKEDGSEYQLTLEREQFRDYFLSMKEMKCLEGPELWCHLAYPYQQPHKVTVDNLRWLEHDLLFMFKTPKEFGANFWNGIYYNMQVENGIITGEAQAVDLNVLASPPDDLSVPPVGEAELDEVDRDKRWLPMIEIR
ncbi:hypothetical protein [Neptunomonas japonica]|uniref:Uncharacterized protein n=1 Tax=Neptunomonas japonica JAMM 1380 TaxID=1441457 RepID=A0A7R6PIP2_9GAMM|nr:hypothetical protein [Neptunomonas japonica]BBB30907.1 conserved hypothetical protein [Neptunomonas japonica JAMM 1380]